MHLFIHDNSRTAFLTFLLLLFFYSYGHIYNLFLDRRILPAGIPGHIIFLVIWAALAAVITWLTMRRPGGQAGLTPVLNIFSAFLLIYPLFQLAKYEYARLPHSVSPLGVNASAASKPDIYYIILDAYDRADTMKLVYDYDNSAFLDALTQRGFYVASCSQSNYAYTKPSLASSLNLDYLDALGVTSNAQADPLLKNNTARNFLKNQGYIVVAFETGFSWSQWEDADVYYPFREDAGSINSFETLFLRTTLLRIPLDAFQPGQSAPYGVIPHDRIFYILDTLKNIPALVKSPKFVFVHLTIPHPPFVFSPTGELVTAGAENATSLDGYRNSVAFINQAVLQVVDGLVKTSSSPPIIILQGDHGAPLYHNPFQRMAILNAYYIPSSKTPLYPSISPVNTFRVIFNEYFGQHYPLLPDVSMYSPTNRIYDFSPIPNECEP